MGGDVDQAVYAILLCPVCHQQHRDDDDEHCRCAPNYSSHLCRFCGNIWRPAAQPTFGVKALALHGRTDTWPAIGRNADLKEGYPVPPARLVPPLEPVAKPAPQAVTLQAEPAAGQMAPPNCRDRLRMERKAYPRSGCAGCNPKNTHKFACPYWGGK